MDVKTLCLGVLSLGEASGYEIKKFFEDGFSHFYVAGFGSIYPALAKLTNEDYVTCNNIEQEKRPAKKVYRITEAGVKLFRESLAQEYPAHKVRSDFLLQLIFSEALQPSRLEQVLQLRSNDIQQELSHIKDCHQREDLSDGGRFALGYAEAVLQASHDYIAQHRAELLAASKKKGEE